VSLRPASGPPIFLMTNAEGFVFFQDLPSGDYQVEAELEGFSRVSAPFHNKAGETHTIDIQLAPDIEDVITVIAEAPLLDERRAGKTETYKMDEGTGGGGRRKRAPAPPPPPSPSLSSRAELEDLKKGLVGGVKPLPIAIPETGKLLLLSGVLPPQKIGVELEVKAEKEKRGWF
jgi:hypothetical protein